MPLIILFKNKSLRRNNAILYDTYYNKLPTYLPAYKVGIIVYNVNLPTIVIRYTSRFYNSSFYYIANYTRISIIISTLIERFFNSKSAVRTNKPSSKSNFDKLNKNDMLS